MDNFVNVGYNTSNYISIVRVTVAVSCIKPLSEPKVFISL
jgi:hypothetical protein